MQNRLLELKNVGISMVFSMIGYKDVSCILIIVDLLNRLQKPGLQPRST